MGKRDRVWRDGEEEHSIKRKNMGGRRGEERVCVIALCVGMVKWVPKHTKNSLGTCVYHVHLMYNFIIILCYLQLNVNVHSVHYSTTGQSALMSNDCHMTQRIFT